MSTTNLITELSKEELWYIENYGKCLMPSEIGIKTAIILTRLFGGMHHIPVSQIKKMDWKNEYSITFNHFGSMATFDPDHLTRLVLLAHEYCVRVEIQPCAFRYISIVFHNRKNRDGSFYERHPTINQVIGNK